MPLTQTVQAFFDAYTAHDIPAMLALCSPTATFRYVPLADTGTGSIHKAAARLWQLYVDSFPDFKTQVINLIEGKDSTVVCETLNSGTQAQDIGNIQNKGGTLSVPHLFIFEFNTQDLIEKIIAFWDNDTIYAQLEHTETHN
ncbi:nuclear transport factor 2 family protein [Nostoc sp. CHAB 5784]|uniref:nuclear transport factor 2 family protein n=1 Tax=Nostoc mirabile TaxID=2907820 RepID=UPI001E4D87B3|nr:nuclear transport factor 2 family protein [Nostoc mirabile]MCC5668188.1 nuclear transport factor 2 family protein [Nostoc mirabile CHAB5784]